MPYLYNPRYEENPDRFQYLRLPGFPFRILMLDGVILVMLFMRNFAEYLRDPSTTRDDQFDAINALIPLNPRLLRDLEHPYNRPGRPRRLPPMVLRPFRL